MRRAAAPANSALLSEVRIASEVPVARSCSAAFIDLSAAHGRPSIYHFLALELFDLRRRHPHDLAQHFVAMLSQCRCRPQTARRAAHAMFETFVRRRPHYLVVEPLPEAKRLQVFVAMDIHAALHRVSRDADCLKRDG